MIRVECACGRAMEADTKSAGFDRELVEQFQQEHADCVRSTDTSRIEGLLEAVLVELQGGVLPELRNANEHLMVLRRF